MKRILRKVVETLFGRRGKPQAHARERHAEPARAAAAAAAAVPVIVKREEHTLSRSRIDEDALKVLNRLTRFNHTAYLVGGGVRDLLLDRPVKDFDIATSAHPQEIKKLFRNCRLIGRRFRLAHILFRGGKVIEVSTFRKQAGFSDEADILIRSDNTFGTPEEDALRRDFTVNGLFYSITDFTVIDYVRGLEDLQARLIRTIGDPSIRFREDPIRILRAIRLAARLGFQIEPKTRRAMTAHREEIWKSAAPRIVEEFVRMLNQGAAAASFPLLAELDVLEGLLPAFAKHYARPGIQAEVAKDLAALDALEKPREGLSAGLALAVLYFPVFHAATEAAGPDADRNRIAGELLVGDLERLKFPRAQLEKAVQLLASQHRLAQPGRRRQRPGAQAGRGGLADALLLFEITQGDTPEGRALLRRLRALQQRAATQAAEGEAAAPPEGGEAAPGEAPPEGEAEAAAGERPGGKRRRSRRGRRRGGRGRRPAGAEAGTEGETAQGAGTESGTETGGETRPGSAQRAGEPPEEPELSPDRMFGGEDTDLEPPPGSAEETPDQRTD